ncbi:hypothetical protein LUZ60_007071 [Juncus effusus]|nr:hypothetical protein LUZ60_007071 [Juncus effusus]
MVAKDTCCRVGSLKPLNSLLLPHLKPQSPTNQKAKTEQKKETRKLEKMVHKFNRSISFPLSPSLKGRRASYHVRSVSLPCRAHPRLSNLEEQIRAVHSLTKSTDLSVETGLSQIELLHGAMNEFLNLSETKNTLSSLSSIDSLLEDFLNLADSYGSFLSVIVMLKQQLSEVQSAFRRKDATWLASSLRSQKKIEKDLIQITSQLRSVSSCSNLRLGSNASEAEIVGILKEAINAINLASVAIFTKIASISSNASSSASGSIKRGALKEEKETMVVDKFEELEECVKILENQSERVFRTAVKSRVLLLNVRSDSF